MTIQDAFSDFSARLAQLYEKREAANIADWVFENVTGFKRLDRLVLKNVELNENVRNHLGNILHELLQEKPIQYVLGEAWFYKMKFFVNEHVLIPRPETEELVSWVIEDVSQPLADRQDDRLQILDIGTGSGCIAVSLKKELPDAEIVAIDVSRQALDVAKKNAEALQTRINFLEIDFLDERLWNELNRYDLIVSNPPYIPEIEKDKLAKNVAEFEPGIALFVQNNNPFIFYEKISKFAQSHLKQNGRIFVEIHEDLSLATEQVFKRHQFETEIKEDMYKKKRMIKVM